MMPETNELKENNNAESNKEDTSKSDVRYDLEFILDIPLDVSVELGKAKMLVNDLLQLGQGSVVELDKAVGEPADIYVNKKLIAKGEIVVMDEKFCIKITESISPTERIKSLS
jgi:flagellar motor switch protein FliN/FliY